tara:strand:+ start:74 stop:202 length:129 start_codon:yes stop_codon:yes gene_type:complete
MAASTAITAVVRELVFVFAQAGHLIIHLKIYPTSLAIAFLAL